MVGRWEAWTRGVRRDLVVVRLVMWKGRGVRLRSRSVVVERGWRVGAERLWEMEGRVIGFGEIGGRVVVETVGLEG